jgi:hypothetical protein
LERWWQSAGLRLGFWFVGAAVGNFGHYRCGREGGGRTGGSSAAVGLPPQPRDAGGWSAGPEGWNTGGQGHHHCCRRTLGGDRREVGATGGGGHALSSRITKLSKKVGLGIHSEKSTIGKPALGAMAQNLHGCRIVFPF